MSVAERGRFPGASQSFHRGRITGHLDTGTYRPPSRSLAYTYEVAGRAGFGLAIDTACHDLDGQDVTTLRMVPVASSPKGIESVIPSSSGMPAVSASTIATWLRIPITSCMSSSRFPIGAHPRHT